MGDGGKATLARLSQPTDVTVAFDGTLYITDSVNSRIRVVTPDGDINTLAGTPAFYNTSAGDGGAPGLAGVTTSVRSSFGPDNALYFVEGRNTARRIRSTIPGVVPNSNPLVPSADGREVYEFDRNGRHLRTRHALTGGVLFTFGYSSSGRLITITDGDGNVTTVNRDPDGTPTSIVGPYGRTTAVETNGDGFLSRVQDPANQETSFTYTPLGLLLTMTDARNGLHQYDWDAEGRLIRDENAAGGFQILSRSTTASTRTITHSTAEGVLSTYVKEQLPSNQERQTYARRISIPSVTIVDRNKQTTSRTDPDGTQTVTTLKPSPRWQMLEPLPTETVTTPAGLARTTSVMQSATSSPSDPVTAQSVTEQLVTNGLTTTTMFSGLGGRSITVTSPVGRTATTLLDPLGRPSQISVPTLSPVNALYDLRGRLQSITQGTRTTVNTYDANGDLAAITNALNQTETFDHDPNGRVTARHRADGTVVGFGYDALGNLTSITLPGKPAHFFTYTPDNRVESYTTPDAGNGPAVTTYQYDLDGHPTQVTRPDGSQVTMGYDPSGRMASMSMPGGAMTFGYSPTSGKLTSATGPSNVNLGFAYDGSLLLNTTWTGGVAGSVARTYDNHFRVATETVNGQSSTQATFGYDNDGLVTSVATPGGSMSLVYDPQTPRLQTTTLGGVTDTRTYDAFGQVQTYTARFGTTVLYDVTYTRDALGRILAKDETVQGDQKLTEYDYDQVGRLITVSKSGAVVRAYEYDDNGNRTAFHDVAGNRSPALRG